MKTEAKVALGVGAALGLLYLATSASASEGAVPEIDTAPRTFVQALERAGYQDVPAPTKSQGHIVAIVARTGLEPGEASALAWVRSYQSAGDTVLVSKDFLEGVSEGTLVLALSPEAAKEFDDVDTFFRLPKV